MKGKQLTLQEVLNLEDGTKVWVEDDIYDDCNDIYIKYDNTLYNISNSDLRYSLIDVSDSEVDKDTIDFYEWIKDNTPLHKMAQEICSLRGLDLTDENIRLIVEEFSK